MTEEDSAIYQLFSDDWMETAAYWGLIMLVLSSGYLRGHLDGSGMSTEAHVEMVMANGPYWPMVLFGMGMVLGFAVFATKLSSRWSL